MSIKKSSTKKQISSDGFRFRGMKTTRLENLTDTIFGFSITLLVISSEVPKSYVELQASMYSFVGFLFCILLLLSIWNAHRNFFKYYGLQDSTTKVLNFLFLFVLLFYIYPLKYLFSYLGTAIYASIKTSLGDSSQGLQLAIKKLSQSNLSTDQWSDIMIRFGLGLFLIYLIFMLLHVNAFKKRKELKMNKKECYLTKTYIQLYGILLAIISLSISIVLIFGGKHSDTAGFVYLLIPFVLPFHRRFREKRYRKIKNRKKMIIENSFPSHLDQDETNATENGDNTTP